MIDFVTFIIVFLTAIVLSVFNFITIAVLLIDDVFRRKVATYPILSFLLGSILQGLFAAPLYAYKELGYDKGLPIWICDLQRISYFICHHTIKWSLLVVSLDRLCAIMHPFKYVNEITRRNMISILIALWVITCAIDIVPFTHGKHPTKNCSYQPHRIWSFIVISMYNIIPFLLILVNYALIWKKAAETALEDKVRHNSLHCMAVLNKNEDKPQMELEPISVYMKSKLKFLLEMKATKTSFCLLLTYVCCWGPLGVFYMIDQFCNKCLSAGDSHRYTKMIVKCLSFSSSIIIPVIYCWFTKDYQNTVKRLFRKMVR